MAAGKEIRTKIKSVQNTQKITKAMEMVAASKMRKAQDRMRAARPYAKKIRMVIAHLAHAHSEYHHPYLIPLRRSAQIALGELAAFAVVPGGVAAPVIRFWALLRGGMPLRAIS